MAIRIQLSDFTYVARHLRFGGKSLRFTWALMLDGPDGQIGEFAMEGCVAYFRGNGDLVWSPPMTRWGAGGRTCQQHWVNPYLYNITLNALGENSKLLRPLRTLFEELVAQKLRFDADLPSKIEKTLDFGPIMGLEVTEKIVDKPPVKLIDMKKAKVKHGTRKA